eukprot:scaffold25757_cov56-Attheya_sp.AAC.2
MTKFISSQSTNTSNDILYRAHPNFQNGGAWYEWTMVVFEIDDDVSPKGFYPYGYYPTKVLTFIEHIKVVNTQTITETYAIVHSYIDSDHTRYSALTESWTLQYDDNGHPVITAIPVESIYACVLLSTHYVAQNKDAFYDAISELITS